MIVLSFRRYTGNPAKEYLFWKYFGFHYLYRHNFPIGVMSRRHLRSSTDCNSASREVREMCPVGVGRAGHGVSENRRQCQGPYCWLYVSSRHPFCNLRGTERRVAPTVWAALQVLPSNKVLSLADLSIFFSTSGLTGGGMGRIIH